MLSYLQQGDFSVSVYTRNIKFADLAPVSDMEIPRNIFAIFVEMPWRMSVVLSGASIEKVK